MTKLEIKNSMTREFVNHETIQQVYGLTQDKTFDEQFSKVSIENILFDIVSYTVYLLRLFFEQKEKEIDDKLYNQKSGRLSWYRTMALNFQLGFPLVLDHDYYDNTNYTSDEIEESKIIKYATANNGDNMGKIVVKVATENADKKLSPIDETALDAIEAYFDEIVYAGNEVTVINYEPDKLYLSLKIYRNPLVLDQNGTSMISGGNPVESAVQEFMKELPFDGELVLASLIDKLQDVSGVKIPHLVYAQHSYMTGSGFSQPEYIEVKTIPNAGYFEVIFDKVEYVV